MDKTKKLAVYNLVVNECNSTTCDGTGVKFLSLVSDPAIKVDFVKFSDEEKKTFKFKTYDVAKRCLIGPIMLVDKPIYRKDVVTGEEYYVNFDAQSIENCQKNFMANKYNDQIDIEHQNDKVPDTYLLENWIIEDPEHDKSSTFGFKLNKGDWMGVVYCSTEEAWKNYVMTGKVNGFSAEVGVDFSSKIAEVEIKNYNSQQKFSSEEDEILEMIAQILTSKNNS